MSLQGISKSVMERGAGRKRDMESEVRSWNSRSQGANRCVCGHWQKDSGDDTQHPVRICAGREKASPKEPTRIKEEDRRTSAHAAYFPAIPAPVPTVPSTHKGPRLKYANSMYFGIKFADYPGYYFRQKKKNTWNIIMDDA